MANSIESKVLCVGLKTSCLGTSLLDGDVTDEVVQRHNAADGALRVTKTRLKDAIAPFKKLRGEARRFFNANSLPGISDDLRIVPSARLETLRREVEKFNQQDAQLLANLRANYPAEIAKDRAALGDRFDPSLYPSEEALGQFFSITLNVCDLPAGDYDRVAGLDTEARERMKREHEAMLTNVAVNARNAVLRDATQLIRALADKMSDPDARVFRESTVENLKGYLDKMADLNITGDPVLEAIRKEATEKLNYSIEELRRSRSLREKAAAQAQDILRRYSAPGEGRSLLTTPPPATEGAAA